MNGDLISRSALLEEFQFRLPINSERTRVIARCVETARKIINEAPAVDAVEVDRVALMLHDAVGDPCACNVNCNDEWLSEVCDLQDECPYPQGVLDCWKQYIKHYGERRADNAD